jgi:hypothetical protein
LGWLRVFFNDVRTVPMGHAGSKVPRQIPHVFRHADFLGPGKTGALPLPFGLFLKHARNVIHRGISA